MLRTPAFSFGPGTRTVEAGGLGATRSRFLLTLFQVSVSRPHFFFGNPFSWITWEMVASNKNSVESSNVVPIGIPTTLTYNSGVLSGM